LTAAQQTLLNPRGVNAIRAFPERGIRVWGARTCSSNAEWKYLNVRRYFLFLAESIVKGTRWAVFEHNDESLWAQVRQSITHFLVEQWRAGALMGNKPEQAFFVQVDRRTMTQDDIDNGRLIVVVGIATVRPAEFISLRFMHSSDGSEVTDP
jgi:phage tail sheath protein FI